MVAGPQEAEWGPLWSSWVKPEVLTAAHPASSPRSVAQLPSSQIKVSISVSSEENDQKLQKTYSENPPFFSPAAQTPVFQS